MTFDPLRRLLNSSRRRSLAALAVTSTLLAACADDKPLNTFEPRGQRATDIDNLMTWIWPIMGVVFVLVVGGGIGLAMKNRVRPEDYDPNDLPTQTHGNTVLELAWTIAPAVLLAGICIPMVQGIRSLETKNADDELDVMVIGQQWWWEYRYDVDGDGFFIEDANGDGVVDDQDPLDALVLPLELVLDPDDVVTANELVIPAGQQVDLMLTSRDVIHSFWIPRLNGKRDTVPGRWHTWSLDAYEPGKFTGWCTEYCGLSHARMRMSAIALPEAEFEQWLADQTQPAAVPTDEQALRGRELVIGQGCTNCHVLREDPLPEGSDLLAGAMYSDDFASTVPLVSRAAPNLTHFASRSSFAGGIFGTYLGEGTDPNDDALDVATYLDLSGNYRWNTPELKRWVKEASANKAMAPDPVLVDPDDPESESLGRGMLPYTQLTDEQLDDIVAYLATLE